MFLSLNSIVKTFASSLVLAGAIACSRLPVEEIPVTANPTTEIDKLSAALTAAESQQVDVLSPKYFSDASDALGEAREARSKGAESRKILDAVAVGNANLAKATEISKISEQSLETVVKLRADAVAANAPKLLGKEFKSTDSLLTDTTRQIENENLSAAADAKGALTKQYSDLELRAIKLDKLGAATATIEKAKNEGADKIASRTLKAAQKSVADADAFINGNRHDKAGIDAQAAAATSSADHLLDITRQVKVAGNSDAESLVLDREAQKGKLTAEVAAGDATTAQLNQANAAAGALQAKNSALDTELQGEKLAEAKLEAAKALFSPNEAEVYRDGNRLVIRMKTIAFPSGKATLPAESFPVLGKVQRVIRDLNASHVTVEGHTDAVGSPVKNKNLSNERATAISGYLAANGVSATEISTVGYGDTKPLTSNKTKEGRAQNRRVDVIIEPQVMH